MFKSIGKSVRPQGIARLIEIGLTLMFGPSNLK